MATLSNKYREWLFRALRLMIATGIAVLVCQFDFHSFESWTYDIRYRLKPTSPISGQIHTIAIDQSTVEVLGRDPNAKDHIRLLNSLSKLQPRAIVYVMDMSGVVGSYGELEQLAKVAEKTNFFVAVDELAIKGLEDELSLQAPLDKLTVVPGPVTRDKKLFAKDGVTRRFVYSFQDRKTLHPQLAATFNQMTEADDYYGLFDFLGSKQGYIDFKPRGTYISSSFLDIMNGVGDVEQFRDKVIVVGRDTLAATSDYIQTPFSRDINAMSLLELHANVFDTLILNRSPIQTPKWLDLLITGLVAIITVFVVLMVRPVKGLLILFATVGSFSILSYIMLAAAQLSLSMSHPLVTTFICYYFFIPYRLIIENRKSWEYYHKNKLLTQVEELKSNFLRMMSHDLKTPLARIQGMADIVLNDETTQLNDSNKNALKTINKSSEELTEFIGSVLDLGRIESKEIKLHLKSKDVNSLLRVTVKKLEYLAKQKGIELITEFEPLFSTKIDESLMRQVFTNLIENAIKYSPENSKVLITTEELNGAIIVQVADQGIGIPTHEQENVFSKFYRSNKVTNTDVKGSGLGLYLADYFVKLHKGKIVLESEPNKGSTFSVELPMDIES